MAEATQHISEVWHTSVLSNLGLLANLIIFDILISATLEDILVVQKPRIQLFFNASLWRKAGIHDPTAN